MLADVTTNGDVNLLVVVLLILLIIAVFIWIVRR
jgi:flagellar biogenesis protein FliO